MSGPILNVRVYEDGKTTYCEPSLITKLRGKLLSSGSTLIFGHGYSKYVLEQVFKHLPNITDNYVVTDEMPFKHDKIEINNALVIRGQYVIIAIGWQTIVHIYPEGEPSRKNTPVNNISMKLGADYDFGRTWVANISLKINPTLDNTYTFQSRDIEGTFVCEKCQEKTVRQLTYISRLRGIYNPGLYSETIYQNDVMYVGKLHTFGEKTILIRNNGDKYYHLVDIDSEGNITKIHKQYDDSGFMRKVYNIRVNRPLDFTISGDYDDFTDEKYIKMIIENKFPVTFEYI
jgi:hypothetical protein